MSSQIRTSFAKRYGTNGKAIETSEFTANHLDDTVHLHITDKNGRVKSFEFSKESWAKLFIDDGGLR